MRKIERKYEKLEGKFKKNLEESMRKLEMKYENLKESMKRKRKKKKE